MKYPLPSSATNHSPVRSLRPFWMEDQDSLTLSQLFYTVDYRKDIYMGPFPGYEEDGMVWKLKKCLYGLKKSAREWYATIKLPTYKGISDVQL